MNDKSKTKAQLIEEIKSLRHRLQSNECPEISQNSKGPVNTFKCPVGFKENCCYYSILSADRDAVSSEPNLPMSVVNTDKFSFILDNLNDLVVEYNQNQELIFVSSNYCKTFGVEEKDIIGQSFLPLVHEDDVERVKASVASLSKPPHTTYHEERAKTLAGWRWFGWSVKAIVDDAGKIVQSIAVGRDITGRKTAEIDRIESLTKKENIFKAAPIGIGMVVNRVITEVNDCFCDMFGYKKDELIGQNSRMMYASDESYEKVGKNKYKQIEEKGIGTVETKMKHKGGRVLDVMLSSMPLNRENLSDGVTFTVTNITPQKKALRLLKESENKFRTLVDHAPEALFLHDMQGRFTDVNHAALTRYGYTREELLNLTVDMIDPDAVKRDDYHNFWMVLEEKKDIHFEARHQRKDGHIFPVEISLSAVELEGIKYILALVSDLTVQKELLSNIQKSEEAFRLLSEASPVGIYKTDAKGDCVYANPALLKMTGLSFDEALGRGWTEALHPEDREAVSESWYHSQSSRKEWNVECRFQTAEGRITWVYGTIAEVKDEDGRLEGYIGTNVDITKRKMAEIELEKTRENLESVASQIPGAIFQYRVDAEGNYFIDYMSEGAIDLMNLSMEEILDFESMFKNLHPDDQDRFGASIEDSRTHLTPWELEYRIFWRDQSIHWIKGKSVPKRQPDGSTLWRGILLDITNEKIATAGLALQQEKYELLYNSMMDAYAYHEIILDGSGVPVDYRFLDVNPAFEKLTGLSKEAVIGKTVLDVLPGTEEYWISNYGQVAVTGESIVMENYSKEIDKYFEIYAFCPEKGRFAVIFRDVTERVKHNTLLESRLKLTELANVSSADKWIQAFLDETEKLTGSSVSFFHLLDDDQATIHLQEWSANTLETYCSAEAHGMHYPVDKAGVWADCIRQRKPVIHNDYASLEHKKGLPEGHAPVVRELVVPVFRNEKIKCLMGVGNKERDYHEGDVETIETLAGSVLDIYERKVAEDKIVKSEKKYSGILRTALDGFFILNRERQITDVNDAYCEMLGYERQELLQMNINQIDVVEDVEVTWARMDQIINEGELRFQTKQKRKDGKIIDVAISCFYYEFEGGLFVVFIKDITEKLKMEKEIFESEERYRLIVENADIGIGYYSLDGRVKMLNQKACQFMGVEKQDQLIGHSLPDMFGEEAGKVYIDRINAAAESEEPNIYEDLVPVAAGNIWFRSIYSRVFDTDGNTAGIQIMSEDITEQKNAENQRELFTQELEKKNAELERFTYTISHDLKNPMITVEGFIGVLEKELAAGTLDNAKHYMKRIREATRNMDALLKDILELSRIGRIIYPPVHVPFKDIVEEVMLIMKPRLEKENIKVKIAPDLPTLFCDKMRLIEVMVNLVENAHKYMGSQQQPVIEIGTREDENNHVVFVSDNGLGIEPKYQEKVFQLFDQLNPAIEGTGLGLALVRRIIEVHQGKIWIESDGKNQGSTFVFAIPRK